jgi:type I restriction enzyme S subunit
VSDKNGSGSLPGWAYGRLGDAVEVIRGVTYRKEDSRKAAGEGLIPVLRANNIQDALVFDDLVYVPTTDVSEDQVLQIGDIVVAASSGSRAIVGKAAQLHHDWYGAFGAFCFVLRPEQLLEPRFVGWFLQTQEYRNRVSKASAGVNINNLRAEHIEETPFRFPPLLEQQRIADALEELLSDLDAGVAALEQVREKLTLYRAAILKAAVDGALTVEWRKRHTQTGPAFELLKRILTERRQRWEEEQLRKFTGKDQEPPKNWKAKYKEPAPPDTADLPPLPEGWCWSSIDQLSVLVTSGSRGWGEYYSDEGAIFIRAQDIRTDRLELENAARVTPPKKSEGSRTLVQYGDVLVTITGANVAKTAIVEVALAEAYVSQHVGLIRLVSPALARLVHTYAVAPSGGRKRLLALAYGAGKPGLNLDNLRELPVPLPPLAEQEAMVESVEDQISVIDHLESDLDAKLKNAQALRQSVLRHAFSGRLVPQDLTDEPAYELLKRIAAEREQRAREEAAAKRLNGQKPRRAIKDRRKVARAKSANKKATQDGRIADR